MRTLTRSDIELEVANAVSNYHCDQQGRAPGRLTVTIARDTIFVMSSDVFTPCEQELHKSAEGRKLIKSARRELRSLTRESAHAAISRIVGCPVVRSFWDLDVRTGDQLESYVLSEDVERRCQAELR